jgi:F0F1-type ATP synthase assembly protein I
VSWALRECSVVEGPEEIEQTGQSGQKGRGTLGKGAAYQGAVEAVFAILVAAGIGYWADQRFESSPLYLFIGLAIGFAAFVLRVVRMRPTQAPPLGGSGERGSPAQRDDA